MDEVESVEAARELGRVKGAKEKEEGKTGTPRRNKWPKGIVLVQFDDINCFRTYLPKIGSMTSFGNSATFCRLSGEEP